MELEVKRGLVRNTLIWYMTSGTPAAVEELVAIVFGEGEVAEILEQMHEEVSKELQGRGLTLERLTGRQVREIFGMDSLEELEAMMRSQAEIEIATNLWLMRIHGKNSVEEIEGYPYGFLDEYAHEIIRFTEEN